MFWSNPSLGLKAKPSKKPAQAGSSAVPRLHGVTAVKTVLFIVSCCETSTVSDGLETVWMVTLRYSLAICRERPTFSLEEWNFIQRQ
jgi:hypothetical protein